ncbi:threonine-phosphate decarboxylase CobD [Microvirga massiliensis]|uniref:threonine-phosphate decarboxylase CobD n=1 Tax=Microvirga massiliensis TaxID=1033741 RepID=UPI00093D15D8
MSEKQIWHGGDLDEAQRLFPDAPKPWIDLSTGINPIPYPLPALPSHLLERLPPPGAHADLEAAAAEAYGTSDTAAVVAAPGTQVLISLLPLLRSRSRVAVLGPTYAEHAVSWRRAGHEVVEVTSLTDAAGSDVLVVVNPNNPDGRFIARQTLLELAEHFHRCSGWLVVDEAFADFDDDATLVAHQPPNTIILRSFGKTFGLAGLRLGFAIAPKAIASRIRAALGPWAVSGPAIELGRRALRDREWRVAAAQARVEDARRLDAMLLRVAEGALGGTTLYRLVETDDGPELFSYLGRHGIWVRRFQSNPRLLRFGLPGPGWAWSRLDEAIRNWSPPNDGEQPTDARARSSHKELPA